MKHDVFISYSRKDKAIVDEICELLEDSNISYWRDTHEINPGNAFMSDIVDAIKACKITLFISSCNSNHSPYTAKEVALAFNEGKHIIPYKIDDSSFCRNLELLFSDINFTEAIPYSRQKAICLVADIRSLLTGQQIVNQKVSERQYIDVSSWDEPSNKVLKFIKQIFKDK
jgi:hypothetical protein